LVLHPTKTKLVYCKDTNRRGEFPVQSFDFLEALAIVATMVGALTLARAIDDPELSDRILAAARTRLASR
jgi:hypothetical protein